MENYLDFFDDEIKISKSFNTSGVCIEGKHYMVNINKKLREIVRLVQHEKYFVINRPRQYGKTTTLSKLEKILSTRYKVLSLDFEGMTSYFKSEETFCNRMRIKIIECVGYEIREIDTLGDLGDIISEITKKEDIVLMIDEVDKISNNQLFLDFLGVLRGLFLARAVGKSSTFKSIILVGVHDIKNLKLKFRNGIDTKYNSPWNIAVNFTVDMSFSSDEIKTMIEEYNSENSLSMDVLSISKELYKFTGGYPFLVSRVCQIIDEIIVSKKRNWTIEDIHKAIKLLLEENNTLFDDLIKNLENNEDLFEYIYSVLVLGIPKLFNISNPIISLGHMYGYLEKSKEGMVQVSNQILREYIYNYMISRANNNEMSGYNFKNNFVTEDNGLDMKKVLLKFQQFMKENYSTRDKEFLERHGVLLFLAFIKPIINGVGFDYKEVQISEERRLDIVISYNWHKYVIETKIWHGEVAHQNGLVQLKNYLEIEGLNKGYLLIFNFNKTKEYKEMEYYLENKIIFEVLV